jgi:hypothetical protein
LFKGFEESKKMKMQKLEKKGFLNGGWDKPYTFVGYKDGKVTMIKMMATWSTSSRI